MVADFSQLHQYVHQTNEIAYRTIIKGGRSREEKKSETNRRAQQQKAKQKWDGR
jgi:hypothetical protein